MTVLWQEALDEEVTQAGSTGADLSLLLIEFDDAERLRAAESAGKVYGTFAGFLQAVRSVVRRQDILARESEERIWVIARGTSREGAQALAERALTAVKRTTPWRGTPPAASAGVAVLGEDAADRDGLIAACEEDRFGATAAGLGVSWARS